MHRRLFWKPGNRPMIAPYLLVLAATQGCAGGGGSTTEEIRPPNVVIVLLDDAGYGDFGAAAREGVRTPNLRRMASEGLQFTSFYAASPVCSGSRYSLLTGRYPVRAGFSASLTPGDPGGIDPSEWTLAEALHAVGYATAVFGKWHLGSTPEHLPLRHGFDEFYGLPYSHDMRGPRWGRLPVIEGERRVALDPDDSKLAEAFTRRAVDFIGRQGERPFFLYLPYPVPHLPTHPSAAFAGVSPLGPFGDVMEELDHHLGDLLEAIGRHGLDRDTLVVLTSDNGPELDPRGRGGSSDGLRGGKSTTWEGGVRVPTIARWPGTIPAGAVDKRIASAMDLYPTILRLSGAEPPAGKVVDGVDLGSRLRGEQTSGERVYFFYGADSDLQAVRAGRWKLHVKTVNPRQMKDRFGRVPLLFDLQRDPGEWRDLSDSRPEVVERLSRLIDEHREHMAAGESAPLGVDTPPSVVAHGR